MGETIEDMDKEIKIKDNKFNLLADEIGISVEGMLQEIEQMNFTEFSDKTYRFLRK